MIQFNRFKLENGLKVLVHEDNSTPLAAVNILYDVGARDEDENKTGFAHLFEHLMFGGSVNIPAFDKELQKVGGSNNAFTSNDITNYYDMLPANNLETAFWLESDRMLSLAFSEKSLEVQRSVVIEEYKQRYLNQPYGDIWLLLRPLAYQVHPYRWPTIGKEIRHIEEATMDDVKSFFKKHYCPNNAILVVSGNVKTDRVRQLAEKWFGPIPPGEVKEKKLPEEPEQTEKRTKTVHRDVPSNAIYKAFHMCARTDGEYYATDMISDILSRGKSARLYNELVKKQQLFSSIDAYVMGSMDKGLFVFAGKLSEGVAMEQGEEAIQQQIDEIRTHLIEEREIQKVKNKIEASTEFSEVSILHKAMNLAMFELQGDAERVNREVENYRKVSREEIRDMANQVLREENSSALYYFAKK